MSALTKSFSTNDFMWNKNTCTFAQEISTLNIAGDLPASIILISAKTGEKVEFSYWMADKINDEVAGWKYKPALRNDQMHLRNIKLLLIND